MNSPLTRCLTAALLLAGAAGALAAEQTATIAVEPNAANNKASVAAAPAAVTLVYVNGVAPGWREAGQGCKKCNASDVDAARDGSGASYTAQVAAWGEVAFESTTPFDAGSQLSLWARGSGIMAVAIMCEDTANRRYSKDVRMARGAPIDQQSVTVQGSDDEGWISMVIDLGALSNGSASYNRILFKDISGLGFRLALDDVVLGPGSVKAADFGDAFAQLAKLTARIPPLWNSDLATPDAPNSRYIVRFQDAQPLTTAASLCNELRGNLQPGMAQRFRGVCDTSFFKLQGAASSSQSMDWRFLPITVKTQDDLTAIRKLYVGKIAYVEADLTAYALPAAPRARRAVPFRVAARSLRGFDDTEQEEPAYNYLPVEEGTDTTNDQAAYQSASSDTGADDQGAPGCDVFGQGDADTGALPLPAEDNSTDVSASADMTAQDASARSWGQDRMDQLRLPLNGDYSPGDLDGRGVHVFVLDTGLRASHVDFRGRVGQGATFVGSSYADEHGHGTHASGTAVGAIHGIARSAILHPVRVLDAKGAGGYSNIISGMQWVKRYVQSNSIRSAVVSMSLGGPRSAALNDAAADLTSAGITVVVAAGNNRGADACTQSPASAPSSITVGATTRDDTIASYSNIGSCLSLFAPGSGIVSASYASDSGEATMSGTSMATPAVAGVAAMYLQAFPSASPAGVKRALQAAALRQSFEPSSAPYLALAISSRLKGSPAPAPTPAPAPAPAPTPAPTPAPSVPPPKPSVPATSAPAAKPAPPTAAPSRPAAPTPAPAPALSRPSLPSWGGAFAKPAWCASCPSCMFC